MNTHRDALRVRGSQGRLSDTEASTARMYEAADGLLMSGFLFAVSWVVLGLETMSMASRQEVSVFDAVVCSVAGLLILNRLARNKGYKETLSGPDGAGSNSPHHG